MSTMTLDESLDTLHLNAGSTQDMLELYQLKGFSPTELHISAIYGQDSQLLPRDRRPEVVLIESVSRSRMSQLKLCLVS